MKEGKLRVLMVEDSADDAELIRNALNEGGFALDCRRVETAEAMNEALAGGAWDLILCDCELPSFDADAALSLFKNHDLDIPFIIVSGCIGEEAAVSLLKKGAHDFVIKGSSRLIPAVGRSLLEMRTRREFNLAQTALRKSEARIRAIASNLPGMVFQWVLENDGTMHCPYVSEGAQHVLCLSPLALQDNPGLFRERILPEDRPAYDQSQADSAERLATWHWTGRVGCGDDQNVKWIELRATPRKADGDAVVWDGIMTDITANKLAEIEVNHSRQQLAELSSHLQNAKEQERARIAREIHDDIGGTLTAIKCDLLWCTSDTPRDPRFCRSKAASIGSLVDSVIDSTRRISRDLRPAVLDCGIVAAIRWQAEEFTKHCGIPCDALTRREEIILDPDRSVAVFRMFQETLSNIVRHARASRVQVSVDEIEGWLRVEVTDDGCGISEDDLAKPDSFGLRGIRERCRDLGGEMRIACDPAGGTRITVEVPLQPKEIGGPDPAPPGPIMPATGRPAAHSRFRDRTTKDKVRQPRGYANDTSADCG